MPAQEVIFYSSENGDEWLLLADEAGAVTVRHSPNRPSGGEGEDVDLGEFLAREENSPQQQALFRILETLDQNVSSDAIDGLIQAARDSRRA